MALKIYMEDRAEEITDTAAFFHQYTLVQAAGGVIRNDAGDILMIFRRGKWDLPKGKMDAGELPEECAEREVKEETGLVSVVRERFLTTTYHTYTENDRPILKETAWYLYRAPGNQPLVPQEEESITEIIWVQGKEISKYTQNTFELIKDVLETAGIPRLSM